MENNNEFNDFEKNMLSERSLNGNEGNINTNYLIFAGLVKAQNVIVNEGIKEGFTKYRILIEEVEGTCKGLGILSKEYDEALADYKDQEEYKKSDQKEIKLAIKKRILMLQEISKSKPITTELSL